MATMPPGDQDRMTTGTGFTAARIDAALARARSFWLGESRAPRVSLYTQPSYRQATDDDAIVAGAVACIRRDGALGEPDVLPSFWPDFGTISTARMWGGRVIPPPPDGFIHIEPVAHTAADLETLACCPFEESDFARAIRLHRRVCERLETDAVFVRTPDLQGPMNTLALILDQTELMCALTEAPDAVHAALDQITDTLIACLRRFCDTLGRERVIGSIWPYHTLPATMGVSITQDYMPLLGPDAYAEFELPRLKRIADAFGGVWIHCCGVYRQHLPALSTADFRIWGLELAYPQMTPMEVYPLFGDRIACLVGVSPDGAARFPSLLDYARFLATQECARNRFWFAACHEWLDGAELRRVVEGGFGR